MLNIRKHAIRSAIGLLITLCLSLPLVSAKSPLENALWLVTDNETHSKLAIHPIDPVTLADMTEFTPISLGHHYIASFSPDHKTLAAVVWPNASDHAKGILHLIDLTTWEDQSTDVEFNQYVDALYFSQDGNALYWLEPTQTEPQYQMPVAFAVFGCEIAACDPTEELVKLPEDIMPEQVRLLKSGSQLAIYGIPSQSFVAKGAPQVIVVDLDKKEISATITMDGVIAGTKPLENALASNPMPYTYNQPGLAWDIEANKLYVAHPTEDHFTVVDLAQGTAQQIKMVTGKVDSKAKGTMPGMNRMAALNPAGNQLYVSSFRREVTSQADGNFTATMTPLGIQAIDTQQMEATQQTDLPLYEMMLSPDGRYLVATGMQTEIPEGDNGDWKTTASGLYVLDAGNLDTLKQIEAKNNTFFLQGFSTDSRYAYTSNFDSSVVNSTITLRAIDLTNMTIAAERIVPGGYSALLGTLNAVP